MVQQMIHRKFQLRAIGNIVIVVLAAIASGCDSGGAARDLESRVDVAADGFSSITIDGTNSVIEVGQPQQMILNALADEDITGTTVTESAVWSVSDTSVANITQSGLLTGLADGTVNINARFGPLFSATTVRVSSAPLVSIAIEGPEDGVDECSSVQLVAIGNYGDGEPPRILTELVNWAGESETTIGAFNPSDNAGLFRTSGAGAATITATRGDVVSDPPFGLNVVQNLAFISIPANTTTLTTSNSVQLSALATYTDSESPGTPATDITDNASWSSSSTSIATVDNTLPARGRVDANRNGSVTISAACGSVPSASLDLVAGDPEVVESVFFSQSSPLNLTFNSERQIQLRSFVRLETQQEIEITEDSDWTFVSQGNSQNELNNNDGFRGLLTIRGTGQIVVQVEYIGDDFDEAESILNLPQLEINVQ